MITKELHEYYERLLADPEQDVPAKYWCIERVAWEIVLAEDGRVLEALSLCKEDGDKGEKMQVPDHIDRTSKVIPFFLYDNAEYFLGLGKEKAVEKRAYSAELHKEILLSCNDVAAKAVCCFFSRDDALAELRHEKLKDLEKGGFAVFRLRGDSVYIHERPAIRKAWDNYYPEYSKEYLVDVSKRVQCSVTGKFCFPVRLFRKVIGVHGWPSTGVSLVSSNCDSFDSYGKKQVYNASISEEVLSMRGLH